MSTLSKLKLSAQENGSAFIILIDPDKKNDDKIIEIVESANVNDVDAIFVGGSIMMDSRYHERIAKIKSVSNIPVILFPGGVNQINKHFDAILFMSLLSGRNPHYLIGEQVLAAPIIKDIGITIPNNDILISPRVGVGKCQEAANFPYRFRVSGNPFIGKNQKEYPI